MPSIESYKIPSKNRNLFLRVVKGHFATSHSHINYYIDVTMPKNRLSEAKELAKELVSYYSHNTVVDTVLCLDGTQVIGACVANELMKENFMNMNAHQTIYVVTPEMTGTSQMIFRDNIVPMIQGKHVLVLAVSVATGYTAKAAVEAIKYYGGEVSGVASIFSTAEEFDGYKVNSVFNPNDLPEYFTVPSHECPLCKQGKKLDALINSYGYSKLG